MSILFRTAGAWGAGTGANLTPAQVDNNFWELLQSIMEASTDAPEPVGIANIVVVGSQMTVVLTDATELGPYTLPYTAFDWRGTWAPLTSYGLLNVVRVRGLGTFLCVNPHTSATDFDPEEEDTDGPFWQQMWGVTETFGTVNTVSDPTYQVENADFGTTLRFVQSCVVSIPADADLDDPQLGMEVEFEQLASLGTDPSQVFIDGDTGVVVNVPEGLAARTMSQFSTIKAKRVAANEWTLSGHLDEDVT